MKWHLLNGAKNLGSWAKGWLGEEYVFSYYDLKFTLSMKTHILPQAEGPRGGLCPDDLSM